MIPSDERTIEIDGFSIEVAALPADEGVALATRLSGHIGRALKNAAKDGDTGDVISTFGSLLGSLFGAGGLDEAEVKTLMDRLLKGAVVTFEENGATVTRDLAKAKPSAPFAGKGYVLLRAAIFSAEVNLRGFFNGARSGFDALRSKLDAKKPSGVLTILQGSGKPDVS